MMTKKHYEAIAAAFNAARYDVKRKEYAQDDLQDGISYAAEHLADYLATENPRFDRERFLVACGLESFDLCGKLTVPKQALLNPRASKVSL